ncbi:2-desacetyl-2-hydroxyethyl bacteriochlorophyllide A dehydrogenase [Rhodopseudomonas thermotolerans]|jgi:3-hydroxyethyl bacteriochlorophyllide a dehydrogenase|uniref:2-desacetyl-2-hydroxyethyl bacteriochlorophyllide A dehydrogenase n=2 Tax=Rhodopseudomonas TaxID=1073 RepID=A0A336JSE5_9BRAD|nr:MULTISPECIES: chlorophyll synthesis pathway protein BchC [Rhodopseudomonas]AVT75561.1 chlorophyll synthesis pathway protein BchC [Rhodopseudomonas palustris]RED35309.1 2-desacetyl-2-hydroxyethyl bacteriochlorophyllide A dehydrogenase [Rhodopseudomonas pentothenatexigens]REG03152.1 2-desacetyl-2-hydroxyethyl bacteriochlorophyllide A dehydrogenase [Rhodopseudomonas thermotolerans]SSW90999.1 2-desacetyl-2-hydroxyethyl bacteriochlorophyllide A dehydrogenase [Rhodopseudomonas pentothenatexigens]
MDTIAVVLKQPQQVELSRLSLTAPTDDDIVVDVAWSGVSTGTERLLWSGRMPQFPGMGYPLVPGYESVGEVVEAGSATDLKPGQMVFVPGAKCFGEVRGLFGASASRLVVPAKRVVPLDSQLGERGILIALAATAYHAIAARGATPPDCIVGHGVLGRLLARISIALGNPPPVVWEKNPIRSGGAEGYAVIDPASDERRDYRSIYDVSGDPKLLDTLISRIAATGEIVLAGFYSEPLSFSFPPAFMREARIRVAAEWQPPDIGATKALIESGKLSLDGLITHHQEAASAPDAYRIAFEDPACLKMVLNWRPS